MTIPKIREKLQTAVDPKRFEHILGVAETAAYLGCVYGEDRERCEVAGLLHDCAKCYSDESLYELCMEAGIELSEELKASPQLWHAVYGPVEAEKYDISDPGILDAIRYHTTGKAAMTLLEKILFVSDYIEPHRDKARDLKELRILAVNDLDKCTARIMQQTIEYLREHKTAINGETLEAFAYYQQYL